MRRAGTPTATLCSTPSWPGKSGITFSVHEYADDFALITHADHKIHLEMPEMLDEIRALRDTNPGLTTDEFPIVLSAGERRAFTANDIFRDPAWRKRDTDGALRVSVEDADALGLVDGGTARIVTAAGAAARVEVSATMLPGHAALPNGFGLDFVDTDGATTVPGVAPNELTSADWRDAYAGTRGTSTCRRGSKVLAVGRPSGSSRVRRPRQPGPLVHVVHQFVALVDEQARPVGQLVGQPFRFALQTGGLGVGGGSPIGSASAWRPPWRSWRRPAAASDRRDRRGYPTHVAQFRCVRGTTSSSLSSGVA